MVKSLPASVRNGRDSDLIPRSRKSYLGIRRSDLGIQVGNGHLLQYSCLGNPRDIGSWQATVHGVTKSERLSAGARTCARVARMEQTVCRCASEHRVLKGKRQEGCPDMCCM